MASKQFTIDEWFYDYFNDPEKIKTTTAFFLKMLEVCDHICMKEDTPLRNKFFDLDKELSSKPPPGRQIAKAILKNFIYTAGKIEWVHNETEIPEVEHPLHHKDYYLIKLCLATTDKIYITTDKKLKMAIEKNAVILGIKVHHADDFMKEYLKQ